ncbi:MAG: carbamoyl-phosphate synthase (glutamine-hydrolyzing) large subunit [Elusimicrobia bacterium]|nr:carbamoyl-phosphate synthase (glutamine-hydrolyzing) large subunit [Elusimicrobiota bacterium]
MSAPPKKVLVLGSGALKIGEAGEFDYSGSQAIKALKEEGVATVLVNPNIATNQTSEGFADRVYFLPVTPAFVEAVIEKERPDAVLLSFGGQTALNCGVALSRSGVLERAGIRVLGAPVRAIEDTEDRERFTARLREVGAQAPRSRTASSVEEAKAAAAEIGYPVMMRIAYALGGLGSGCCADEDQLVSRCQAALSHAGPAQGSRGQVLVEEFLEGWKEVEYEIVRDCADNCIAVCNMENLDPLGIHTGESIVVAPSQTLTNEEYHRLREIAIRIIRHLGIVGECNVQYALDPGTGDYRVIEVNARLSRSSALASKATGYPLASVAAKLALGKTLLEVENAVTRATKACFEPALDYLVVKIPRWDLKKFRKVSKTIDSGMKSVGEVMAIGRTFEEALQKGLRMLDIGADGLAGGVDIAFEDLAEEIRHPTDERIFAVYQGLRDGLALERIRELSHIDPWFLAKIANIVAVEDELSGWRTQEPPEPLLRRAKRLGFSDRQVAGALGATEDSVRGLRGRLGIRPCVKQIDTLAAEYPAKTNYLYLTYAGSEDDVGPDARPPVLVLGSGAYRIGSSVEFDWCCVNTVKTLRRLGLSAVLVNCNPETVSTDFDECDRLYFEELTLETVLEIHSRERPLGAILSVGGQAANNLALRLSKAGVRILGTQAESIDQAEDRHKFSRLLDRLGVAQPPWSELSTVEEAAAFARKVGYPVLVRPSYVLSGAAMAVAMTDEELRRFLEKAARVSPEHPVVLSKFILGAKEIELDGVARRGEILAYVISEHVENAGVHSGDATIVVPPQRTYLETMRQVQRIAAQVAKALAIHGPFNIQFLAKDNEVSVIECNLRASRSFPFVSKVCGTNLIELAAKVMLDWPVPPVRQEPFHLDYVGVKAPQFSFTRLKGADPTLSVEMASTGEVACLGDDFEEAFLKALAAVGFKFPLRRVLLSTGPQESKVDFLPCARRLGEMGVELLATSGTAAYLRGHGLVVENVDWPLAGGPAAADAHIRRGRVDLVVNIPKNYQTEELTNGYLIRRAAADFGVPLVTNIQQAKRIVEAVSRKSPKDLAIKPWQDYVRT